jgi:hypothetical protein
MTATTIEERAIAFVEANTCVGQQEFTALRTALMED